MESGSGMRAKPVIEEETWESEILCSDYKPQILGKTVDQYNPNLYQLSGGRIHNLPTGNITKCCGSILN